ncbi:MAG: hypothetical protein PHI34_05745 [Acidobacteriota bacterium]|nr:hypothetical protein [Acidobacteriota bacterium]
MSFIVGKFLVWIGIGELFLFSYLGVASLIGIIVFLVILWIVYSVVIGIFKINKEKGDFEYLSLRRIRVRIRVCLVLCVLMTAEIAGGWYLGFITSNRVYFYLWIVLAFALGVAIKNALAFKKRAGELKRLSQ